MAVNDSIHATFCEIFFSGSILGAELIYQGYSKSVWYRTYDFLLTFHSNSNPILYRFQYHSVQNYYCANFQVIPIRDFRFIMLIHIITCHIADAMSTWGIYEEIELGNLTQLYYGWHNYQTTIASLLVLRVYRYVYGCVCVCVCVSAADVHFH